MQTEPSYADVKSLWREHEALVAEVKALRLQGKAFEQRIAALEGRRSSFNETDETTADTQEVPLPRSELRGELAELQKSQATPSTPQMPPADTWAVDSVRLEMYRNAFLKVDADGDGYAEKAEVADLLSKAGLPDDEARSIWSMVDVSSRGRLNIGEFACAMYIGFRRAKQGVPLPGTLPPELRVIAMPPGSTPVAAPSANALLQDVVVSPAPYNGITPVETSNANSLPQVLTSSKLLEPSVGRPEVAQPLAPGEYDGWELDMNRLQMYEGAFRKADQNSDGFVEPLEVQEVLMRAGLPDLENDMRAIWSLVDLSRRRRLNFGEFACGMFVAFRYAKQGVPLPAEIPSNLRRVAASNVGSAAEAAPFLGGVLHAEERNDAALKREAAESILKTKLDENTLKTALDKALPAVSALPLASSVSAASKPPVPANSEVDPFDDLSW